MQRVFTQNWLNSYWIACFHTRLTDYWLLQNCVPLYKTDRIFTESPLPTCYSSFTLFRLHNNNCSLDLYTKDLQTQSFSLYATFRHTRLTEFFIVVPLLALSCILYCSIHNLMYAHEGECLCLREISTNVNKFFYTAFCCWFEVTVA